MTAEPNPDELITQTAEGVEAENRTGLFVGPLADPDRYELLGSPMVGGEGTTWRARYRGDLDQPVQTAIKVLNRPHDAELDWPTAALMRGWRDRVELLHSADLPHVVRLHDVEVGYEPHQLGVTDTHRTVLVRMEWIYGETLLTAVGTRPPSRDELPRRLAWIDDLCVALAGLHGLGNAAVHRDVTPSNCIVTADRGLVLIDLSTMQLPHDAVDLQGRYTPLYSAREVIADPRGPRSPAADRWSVGAIAYYCLTGSHPPRAADEIRVALEVSAAHLGAPAAAAIVLELLDDDPEARPQDLREWSGRLRVALLHPTRDRRRPVVLVLVVAALAAAAAVLLPLTLRESPSADGARIAEAPPSRQPATPTPFARRTASNGASARIAVPANGGAVAACVVLKGTLHLPDDTTVVLVQRLDEAGTSDDPYVEYPLHWDTLTGDTAVAGVQYFNEATRGQHIRLEIVAVDREAAKRQYDADQPETDYAGDAKLVNSGTVLDAVRVVHSLPGTDTSCSAE